MALPHRKLVTLLRRAYSAERAAAFAYIGHARSVRDKEQRAAIRQIEADEWQHRTTVLTIMRRHDIRISRYFEIKYYLVGKLIGLSCHVIGWFMPFYFAGRLESGNVCEYFRMMRYFDDLDIADHHEMLYEMGMKEKEHEVYFLESLETHPLLPLFEKVFGWGARKALNDIDVDTKYSVPELRHFCRKHDN